MSVDQVSEVTPAEQIADLQNELRQTQIQLQKLRAAAWGAADIFRREAEEDCGNGNFIATPTMVKILWEELNGIPEDLDLLRWARDNELADLREENERLREFVANARETISWTMNYCDVEFLLSALAELDAGTIKPAPPAETLGAEGGK